MNKLILLFSLLFGLFIMPKAISQNKSKNNVLEVQYQTTFSSPRTNQMLKSTAPTPKAYENLIKKLEQQKIYYSLLYNIIEKESIYKIDSIQVDKNISLAGNVNYSYLKTDKTFIMNETFLKTNLLIKGNLKELDWTINYNKTINISGYDCYEANSNQMPDVKVWFTPSIPVGIGPEIYYGLPGLVLRAENNFEEINIISLKYTDNISRFNSEKQTIIKKNNSTESIPVKEYVTKKENFLRMVEKGNK